MAMLTTLRVFSTHRHFCKNLLKPTSSCVQILRGCRTQDQKQKFRGYLLTRYLDFIKSYESAMEKRFPAAVRLYRVFSVGVKEFKDDLLCFLQVFKKVSLSGQSNLSRREMEVYHQMPKDMIKVAPVLLVTALPFGGIVFPVAYMFPRILLSYHFWSLQQRSEFAMLEHKEKLRHFRPVFRCLQAQLRSVKGEQLHKPWSRVLGMLGSGVHPSPDEILECGLLFKDKPYHLSHLTTIHISHLLRVHGMHRGWRRRSRLADRARLLRRMDVALIKEGGPSALTSDELRWACFFRGLNPVNVTQKDAEKWLEMWLQVTGKVSTNVEESDLSLLLHTPVLLGYNQPSNWLLLHDART